MVYDERSSLTYHVRLGLGFVFPTIYLSGVFLSQLFSAPAHA
jgi:hypothetical protein